MASTINRLTGAVQRNWAGMHQHIITTLDQRAMALKIKDFVSGEKPKLLSLCEHDQLILFGVYGDEAGRERQVGYCLLFSGAPTVHHYTRYCSFSYSDAQDIHTRQMLVIHDDDDTRLLRFGIGTFDYLWCCRKATQTQFEVDLADHAQHRQFSGAWRDGM